MNFWILSSRLVRTRRDLANNSDKKPKNRRKFAKKIRLKNREIRTNRIKLLLFTFENRRKIKEKSALFGGPYRNSDRQFFYSPQNRGPPPKISPIEQITDRWEPKNSNLQRVTLQFEFFHFFPRKTLFSYLKNERKIFRIFELLLQISRLWTPPVSMISHFTTRPRILGTRPLEF